MFLFHLSIVYIRYVDYHVALIAEEMIIVSCFRDTKRCIYSTLLLLETFSWMDIVCARDRPALS